jgi:hypothetical protein
MRALRWVAVTAIAAVVGVLMLFISGVTIMNMNNVHERRIAAPVALVGALLDTLASADDRFWPHEKWFAFKLDRPLAVGARGDDGRGPQTVSSYTPGRHIRFEFSGPRNGFHEFVLEEAGDGACLLRHTLRAKLTAQRALTWFFAIRPVHDALIEDLFDKVEGQVSDVAHPQVWSVRVKWLRQRRGMSPVKS